MSGLLDFFVLNDWRRASLFLYDPVFLTLDKFTILNMATCVPHLFVSAYRVRHVILGLR